MIKDSKEKYIHIVVGDTAWLYLKEYFRKNSHCKYFGQVINYKDDLSIGSVNNIDNNPGLRILWYKEIFRAQSNLKDKFYTELTKDLLHMYKERLDIEKESKIVIWHGNNVNEQVALRYLVNRFQRNELYEINVSTCLERDINNEYYFRAVAECDIEELEIALDNIEIIHTYRKEELIKQWDILKNTGGTLRVLQDNNIIAVEENYYDNAILEYTTNEYVKATKVIGIVMGILGQVVGDSFLIYRLNKLINNNLIEFQGEIGDIRNLYIRTKENY